MKTVFKSLDISNKKKPIPSNKASKTASVEENKVENTKLMHTKSSGEPIEAGETKIISESARVPSLDVQAQAIHKTLSPRSVAFIEA